MPYVKSKKTKKCLLVSCVLSALTSFSANALFPPFVDYANLAERISGNFKSLMDNEQFKVVGKKAVDAAGKLTGLKVDAQNNATANMIIRKNQARADVQNMEVLEKSNTSINPCFAIALTISNQDWCSTLDQNNELAENRNSEILTVKERNEKNKELVTTDLGVINSIVGGSKGQLTMDNGTYQNDYENALKFTDLISPTLALTDFEIEKSKREPEYMLELYRKKLMMNMSKEAIQGVINKKHDPDPNDNKFSELESLQYFVDQHKVKSNDEIEDSLASKLAVSNLSTPTAIIRTETVMMAYKIHLQLLSFKESLVIEQLEATRLANKIN